MDVVRDNHSAGYRNYSNLVNSTILDKADRYHYLPSIGIAVILAWDIPLLFKRENVRKKILLPVTIAALSIMAVLTWQQCGYWRDSASLFTHALQVTKDNYLAHNNLGTDLFKNGKIEEAMYHYNEAIRLKPDFLRSLQQTGEMFTINSANISVPLRTITKAMFLQPDHRVLPITIGELLIINSASINKAFEELQ